MKTILRLSGIALIAVFLSIAHCMASAGGYYNVRDYGAAGDGKNIDSDAVNEAIKAAASAGGGTVYFPAGTYSCYSIRLENNIRIYLDMGAVIKAAVATQDKGYGLPEENPNNKYQDFGHSHWKNSLIWGIGIHDIAIEGHGMIDGPEGLARGERRSAGINGANKDIALKECWNVTIRDVSMLMCGHFALLATGVDNMILDNLTVDTNRDGFDIDCCSNVSVINCRVNTLNDDAIVLKSSYGLGYAKATENVT
ncbi:MAG: glycosyl hydrolase family 28 protein [Rikenellaceae bacterium]|nr:glycosyl hydrolase family 28 protein [Rikenellaceae bacterium]